MPEPVEEHICLTIGAGIEQSIRILISVFSLFDWEALVIEQSFEHNGGMQLGDPTTDERDQRSPLDEALDDAEQALTTMISLLAAGNLDPLQVGDAQLAFGERIRQRLLGHADQFGVVP